MVAVLGYSPKRLDKARAVEKEQTVPAAVLEGEPMTTSGLMPDARRSVRRNSDAAGTIYDGVAHISCRLENISDSGACVRLASDATIPPVFVLIVPSEKLKRSCFLVWRGCGRIGVQFV